VAQRGIGVVVGAAPAPTMGRSITKRLSAWPAPACRRPVRRQGWYSGACRRMWKSFLSRTNSGTCLA